MLVFLWAYVWQPGDLCLILEQWNLVWGITQISPIFKPVSVHDINSSKAYVKVRAYTIAACGPSTHLHLSAFCTSVR